MMTGNGSASDAQTVKATKDLLTSAPNVKLITTTQKNGNAVAADMHGVHLERMDTNSSAKLLQDVFAVRCKEKDVYKLCGWMVLIHIHCMHTEVRFQRQRFGRTTEMTQLFRKKFFFFHDGIIHREILQFEQNRKVMLVSKNFNNENKKN